MTMDSLAELERIRLFTKSSRQRIRRLDVLLDEQVRILKSDPAFKGRRLGKQSQGHRFTKVELRAFTIAFALAALGAFLSGFWTARLH